MKIRTQLLIVCIFVGFCKWHSKIEKLCEDLEGCRFDDKCAKAVEGITRLSEEERQSSKGIEARLLAIENIIYSKIVDQGFAKRAKIEDAIEWAKNEYIGLKRDVAQSSELEELEKVFAFLRIPTCETWMALLDLSQSNSRFRRLAEMVALSKVYEILKKHSPDEVHLAEMLARDMIGCTMSSLASPSAVMVEIRNIFYDLVDKCDESKGTSFCEEVKRFAKEMVLYFPIPNVQDGMLFNALLPKNVRGFGIEINGPWFLILSAGRLYLRNQGSLPPKIRQVIEPEMRQIFDLREPHTLDHILAVFRTHLKERRFLAINNMKIVGLIVDKNAPTKELFEVLEALTADTDAFFMIATHDERTTKPKFIPLNYKYAFRALDIEMRKITKAMKVLDISFHEDIVLVSDGVKQRELPFRGQDLEFLTMLYMVVKELKGEDQLMGVLSVTPDISVGMMLDCIQILCCKVSPYVLGDVRNFLEATPSDMVDFGFLLPIVVVKPSQD